VLGRKQCEGDRRAGGATLTLPMHVIRQSKPWNEVPALDLQRGAQPAELLLSQVKSDLQSVKQLNDYSVN
jgi:hypothetical protein